MDQYVGVSLKQTWISVRQNRKRIWRGKCYPRAVAEAIRQHAPNAVLVVFETLSTWFHHDLTACQRCASTHGMRRRRSTRRRTRPTRPTPVVARRGRVLPGGKSWAAMQVLVGGRAQLIGIASDLSNQIRGLMRTFGLVVPAGGGRIFEANVRALLYEAATVMLTRVRSDSALRSWGLKLKEKVGFKRAAVALARKLAVVMHAMWRDGRVFDPATGAPA